MKEKIIVGLDIGTTKIACIIAEVGRSEEMKIIGVGVSPSHGLRKGVVVNIDKTVESIEKAVEEAELMAGIDVEEVFVGIAGDHIRAINSRGVIATKGSNNTITKQDVQRAIENAQAISIPTDRQLLHVIPQEYIVDEQKGIKDPLGMCGVRLETQVHIITGAVTSAKNIYRSVEKAGLRVVDLILEPLASSYAVLEEDEKELGVALIDMGGGTTDIAIYSDDSIRYTSVIGYGGEYVTKDIAIGISTPLDKAEEIKRRYGCAFTPLVKNDEVINVPGIGGRGQRPVSRIVLTSFIEPRVEEILTLAMREIKRTEYAGMLGAGIVLTGGCALMEGIVELAERVFERPVKLGVPSGFGGLTEAAQSPIHATGIGLCTYAARHYKDLRSTGRRGSDDYLKKFWERMKKWVEEFF